jgi:tetratricopeptide (TPR) repeat protein
MRLLSILLFFFTGVIFSQNKEGYWDNIRTTNETFTLKSNEKKYIKTADFPEGTTELVYRITVLDDNQKVSSSLVSVLKAIPDPTGISQGAAGAVFLLSTISGEDKCKYAIFTSNEVAENYIKTEKTTNACFVQETPINKEAKLLSSNSKCLTPNTKNLYFAFESDNWVMNEKISLEVVPWVTNKLSRGWNTDTKNEVINYSKKLKVYASLSEKGVFSSCFMNALVKDYTYTEYSSLTDVEKSVIAEKLTESCLIQSGEVKKYYNLFRDLAKTTFDKGNQEEAVNILQTKIIDKKRANAMDYFSLGRFYLLSKQFDKAEKAYNLGLKMDVNEINLQLELAHLYLFTDRLTQAKEIHKKYKNQNVFPKISWTEQTKSDFKLFEKYNLPNKNFNKILRILE